MAKTTLNLTLEQEQEAQELVKTISDNKISSLKDFGSLISTKITEDNNALINSVRTKDCGESISNSLKLLLDNLKTAFLNTAKTTIELFNYFDFQTPIKACD